jgi:hypothetical protein
MAWLQSSNVSVDMAKITVLIEEGKVKAIEGIPVDMHVEVRNYNVDRADKNAVSKDEDGRACEILECHAPE